MPLINAPTGDSISAAMLMSRKPLYQFDAPSHERTKSNFLRSAKGLERDRRWMAVIS
jgi:hypothetical protein